MKRLRKFFRLPRAERRLFVRALFLTAGVRLGLWLFRYPTVRRVLPKQTDPAAPGASAAPSVEQIAWAANAAANYVPGSTCLVRALVGSVLCRRYGLPAEVRIGVGLDAQKNFEAHAWMESDGQVVIGGEESGRFTALASLGGKPL
jgi:hypothetical protein